MNNLNGKFARAISNLVLCLSWKVASLLLWVLHFTNVIPRASKRTTIFIRI